jgi:hypothetical protein
VDTPSINQSIGLLSSKAILDPKSALGLVETGETAGDSEDIAYNDYNSDIIVVNIGYSKNKRGETQELAKYTPTT